MKTCAIMQPTYIPWVGYFSMIRQVDVFVFFDTVQFVRRNWGSRNRIKTAAGELFLTIPISKNKNREDILYVNAEMTDIIWKKKHINSIKFSYSKAPFFKEIFPFIRELLENKKTLLAEFNIAIIKEISRKLGINTKFISASELINVSGKKDTLLASICSEIGCKEYFSPIGSAVYIEKIQPGGIFVDKGIEVFYQNYKPVEYKQLYGEFISHMSIIDLLMNCGFEQTKENLIAGELPHIRSEDISKYI